MVEKLNLFLDLLQSYRVSPGCSLAGAGLWGSCDLTSWGARTMAQDSGRRPCAVSPCHLPWAGTARCFGLWPCPRRLFHVGFWFVVPTRTVTASGSEPGPAAPGAMPRARQSVRLAGLRVSGF